MSRVSEAEPRRSLPIPTRIWQRLEALPLPEPEESLLLRILTQTMVLVGIVATDVAASTQMSFWAIPFSIAGAYW
ncbi:MAG TPA: hypothetical protein V6C64_06410, partial [Microcoleaceae cyanobacterium]